MHYNPHILIEIHQNNLYNPNHPALQTNSPKNCTVCKNNISPIDSENNIPCFCHFKYSKNSIMVFIDGIYFRKEKTYESLGYTLKNSIEDANDESLIFSISKSNFTDELDPRVLYYYNLNNNRIYEYINHSPKDIKKIKESIKYKNIPEELPPVYHYYFNKYNGDIQDNTRDIKYNTRDIQDNTRDIQDNTRDIKHNTSGIEEILLELDKELFKSLKSKEIQDITNYTPYDSTNCIDNGGTNKNYVILFFSGGVDSLLLASYLDNSRIYLINTMFYSSKKKNSFDRNRSKESLVELRKRYPNRNYILVENDILYESIDWCKIKGRVYPKNSAMDYNIGACLYYSGVKAREIIEKEENENFSESGVVIIGSGADELFGGYNLYRKFISINRFLRTVDYFNMFLRNAGRDDRCLGDGLVGYYPFLEEKIVELGLGLEEIFSDNKNKYVLRMLLEKRGLGRLCNTVKRAMQYGSGIAYLEKHHKD